MRKEKLIHVLKEHLHYETVELKHLGLSDFYADIKEAMGIPSTLNLVADEMYTLLDPKITCIVGNGYGGSFIPVIASRYDLKFSMIRDKLKNHGRSKGYLEHHIPTAKDKVAILDDVLSSGGSLKKSGEIVLDETEAEIIEYCVVYKRGELNVKFDRPFKFLLDEKDLL